MATKKKLSEMSEEEIKKLSTEEYDKLFAEQEAEEAAAEEKAKKKGKKKVFTPVRNRVHLTAVEDSKTFNKSVTVEREDFHKNEKLYLPWVEKLYGSKEDAIESGEYQEITEDEFVKLNPGVVRQ